LDEILKKLKIKTLIFTGCVTNYCILFTAVDAFERGYDIILKKNKLGYVNEKNHQFAIKLMKLGFKAKYV
jgi:nicotinamidase-related amidase